MECRAYCISKIVNFLVDTGSCNSAITEKEAILMGLDCSVLPECRIEAIGFGGTFKPKIINRLVVLTFGFGKNEYRINYSSGFRVICFPLNIPDEEREKMLRYTPSVLGMDVLTKFKIYVDRNEVVLTVL